ncbi:MAG: hypothetical protein J5I90_10085, partial [Caldilineales bacterium]|nr:hypothetical protein [Caldilineales bacterium]
MRKTYLLLIALLVMLGLVLAACGGGAAEPTAAPAPTEAPAEEPTEAPAAEPTEAPAEEPAMEATGLTELDAAMAGEYAGSVVTLLGVMVDEDGQKMEMAVAPFEEATGIDVQYTGT